MDALRHVHSLGWQFEGLCCRRRLKPRHHVEKLHLHTSTPRPLAIALATTEIHVSPKLSGSELQFQSTVPGRTEPESVACHRPST